MKQGSARKFIGEKTTRRSPGRFDDFRLTFEIGRKITTVRAEIAVNPGAQRSSSEIVLQGSASNLSVWHLMAGSSMPESTPLTRINGHFFLPAAVPDQH
jgi:hypothetical protein